MAQDQLRKPQPTRGTRGGAFAYCGSHLSHAEPQFTPVYRSRHPRTPQGATKPFAAENSSDHVNYYENFLHFVPPAKDHRVRVDLGKVEMNAINQLLLLATRMPRSMLRAILLNSVSM